MHGRRELFELCQFDQELLFTVGGFAGLLVTVVFSFVSLNMVHWVTTHLLARPRLLNTIRRNNGSGIKS